MFRKSLIVVLCLAAVVSAAPLDRAQIPAGAKWFLHADLEAFMASKMGAKIQEEAQKPGLAQMVQGIQAMFGVDPLKDLKSLTAFGTQFGDDQGAFMIRGKLDQEKLVNLLKLNPAYKEHKIGELTAHEWTDEAKDDKPAQQKFGAFFGPETAIVAPSKDLLTTALAVLAGKADSLAKGPTPAAAPKGTYLTVRVAELPAVGPDKPEAALLSKLSAGWLYAGEEAGKVFVEMVIECRNEQAAANLKKMGEGFLAFLDMALPEGGQTNPKLPPQFPGLVKSAKVTAEGTTARASLSMTADELIQMFHWAQQQKAIPGATPSPAVGGRAIIGSGNVHIVYNTFHTVVQK